LIGLGARLDQVGEQLGAFLDAVGCVMQVREHFLKALFLLAEIAIIATVIEKDAADIVEDHPHLTNLALISIVSASSALRKPTFDSAMVSAAAIRSS
jgi:hypothetical protein